MGAIQTWGFNKILPNTILDEIAWLVRLFRRPGYTTIQKDGKYRYRIPDHNGKPEWEEGERAAYRHNVDGTTDYVGNES